ncbi:MAG: PAS domain-containing protein [Deltaproteobacteria bacterium]|nr:PAS domain-containing protein [Deltaproteobacteria bacterium]
MTTRGIDYLNRRVSLPYWLRLLMILGIGCLIGSAFMAIMDLDRETRNLEQLYVQKGELIIRSLSVAIRQKWVNESSQEGMATLALADEASDVLFLATSDYLGRLRGSSAPTALLGPNALGAPDSPYSFQPQWSPHFKIVSLANGRKSFVVYRPFIFSLEPEKRLQNHHMGRQKELPVWPPVLDMEHPQRAIYCWVGFDVAPFELAAAAGRRNTFIFSGLIGLVLLSALTAVSWSLKFMRNYAVTNEIITRLPVGLILCNPKGQIILANQAAEEIIKKPEKELTGRTLKELTHDAFPSERGELTAYEAYVSFLDGPHMRLSVTSGDVTGPGGTELGQVVLMADVGELSRLKEELAKKERLARLGGIASGLAHEIRNPLGAIKGLTQHLINKSQSPEDEEPLRVILSSVERLSRAINDFQSFANPAINAEKLDLTAFLAKVHQDMSKRPEASGASLELSLPDGPLSVQADPNQLAEAMKSLYLNALQAMEKNPPETPPHLSVSLIKTSSFQAVIGLADNGPGFGLEQLKTPFLPYFSSSAKNAGLSLAKANNLIQAFGGSMQLANTPKGGALVSVFLPLERNGPIDLRLYPMDMIKFMQEIHSFMSYDVKFKNVSMTLDLPSQCPVVNGDKDMLTQALTNVYLNAIQATEANPPAEPGRLAVSLASPDPEHIRISLADNGPGFKQSQLDSPFVPFFTTKSKGMGLGMSIIQTVIDAHDGKVTLENIPEGGGQVTIILPCRPAQKSTLQ